MPSATRKLLLAVIAILVTLAMFVGGLVTGYWRGYVEGRMAEYDTRFRVQKSFLEQVARDMGVLERLHLHRHGDGHVRLAGTLSDKQLSVIQDRVAREYGRSSADFILNDVLVVAEQPSESQ